MKKYLFEGIISASGQFFNKLGKHIDKNTSEYIVRIGDTLTSLFKEVNTRKDKHLLYRTILRLRNFTDLFTGSPAILKKVNDVIDLGEQEYLPLAREVTNFSDDTDSFDLDSRSFNILNVL